jgi:four helix bundle protein
MFTHEKFEAYQLAIQFTRLALQCLDEMPPENAHVRDQLRRAAFSVSSNIAEGIGTKGRSDRVRLYSVARGSAVDCAAICKFIAIAHPASLPKTELAKATLKSILNILSTVCSSR